MKLWILSTIILISIAKPLANEHFTNKAMLMQTAIFVQEYASIKYPTEDFSTFIFVSIAQQKLYYIKNDSLMKTYDVSTAKNGIGNTYGSHQTPLGLHYIKSKYGHDVPEGGIFKSRKYTGNQACILQDSTDTPDDYITSRIITLVGTERGYNKGGNVDSYARNIYIHGTPEEGLIGTPASHGCIRMRNSDIIELFDIVQEKLLVLVVE